MPTTLEDYEILGPIGSGSYGSCAKIRRLKDNKILVWKVIDYLTMSETEKQMLVSEVNVLRDLRHENIVRYYDRIIDRRQSRLYIIMELCEGGDLSELIMKTKRAGSRTEEEFVWQVCYQVASALKECHCRRSKKGDGSSAKIMHRDLKPANVFLDSKLNVKLGDFGMARVLNSDASFARTFVGTPYYMSPELMNGQKYNEKSDVWALGCLLYELCALSPPFKAFSQTELANRICAGQFAPLPAGYSADLRDMIALLLTVQEARRPSIQDVLAHPLLLKHIKPATCTHCGAAAAQQSLESQQLCAQLEALQRRERAQVERESVLRRLESDLERRESALSRVESDLDERSRDLTARRTELDRRQVELERREKSVSLKEALTDERMLKAEQLLKEYAEARLRISTNRKISAAPPRLSTGSDTGSNISSPDASRRRRVGSSPRPSIPALRGHSSPAHANPRLLDLVPKSPASGPPPLIREPSRSPRGLNMALFRVVNENRQPLRRLDQHVNRAGQDESSHETPISSKPPLPSPLGRVDSVTS